MYDSFNLRLFLFEINLRFVLLHNWLKILILQMVVNIFLSCLFKLFDILLVDVAEEWQDLGVGAVDREDDGQEDALGNSGENYTKCHHDEEVLFIIECSVEVEVEELISYWDTTR